MKTLGVILMVTGLLISIIGHAQYADVMCYCPAQIEGKPFNCGCGEGLEQTIGHIAIFVGFAITGGGIVLFAFGWRKQQSLAGAKR